jgi:hypothetical protein
VRALIASAVVHTLAVSSTQPAGADEYVPSHPVHRPSLGWICWPDRVLGDFDGDGSLEPAVRWNRSGPHRVCDERGPVDRRWHLTLLLGRGVRVERPLPCEGPLFCRLWSGDLNLDGRDELLVDACCGASYGETRAYALLGGRLRALVYAGPPVAWLEPGPLVLPVVANSATDVRFGCRTHPNGSRVIVVRAAELLEDGRWRIERARLRAEDGPVRLLGVRTDRVAPRGERLPDLRAEPCASTP